MKKTMKNILLLITLTVFQFTVLYSQDENNVITVHGKIYDAVTKNPVEGLSVIVPDYSATFTFTEGDFTVDIPSENAVISIEGLNYNSINVPVKGRDSLKIYVYKGYHNSFNKNYDTYYEKSQLLYSTSAIDVYHGNEEQWKTLSTTADDFFDDKLAGLNVVKNSGTFGIGSNIILRGYNSLYSTNQPLIVLDGFIFDIDYFGDDVINGFRTNPLMYIDENDIESVTVLKDATSLYGAKGANGVIFIRTDHASEMATKIDLSVSGGINFAPKNIDVLNSDEYRSFLSDIKQTDDQYDVSTAPYFNDDKTFIDYYKYHNNFNWQDEIFNNSYNKSVKFKIKGGDDIALYMVSMGYTNYKGIVKNTDFSRYNLRFNSDININKKLSVSTNISVAYAFANLKDEGITEESSNPVFLSRIKAPIFYPYERDEMGNISPNLNDVDDFNVSNPVAVIENVEAVSRDYRIMAFADAQYKLTKDFEISNMIGISSDKVRDAIFRPDLGLVDKNLIIDSSTTASVQKILKLYSFKNDFRVKYSRSINNAVNVTGLAGFRALVNTAGENWSIDYNSPNDEYRNQGHGDSKLIKDDGNVYEWNSLTYYFQGNVNYYKKYFLTVGGSLYGSSRFGDEGKGITLFANKFGFFPFVSAAWLISSEKFMNDIHFIDLLKIRTSIGKTGNEDVGYYSYSKLYTTQSFMNASGAVVSNLQNTSIGYEVMKKINFGLDISVLNERLNVSADFYKNRSEGLYNFIRPNTFVTGQDYYIDNDGVLETKGVDLTISGRIINRELKWDLGLIYTKYKSTLVEFPNDGEVIEVLDGFITLRNGESPVQFFGHKSLGVIKSTSEAETLDLVDTYQREFKAGDIQFANLSETDENVINDKDRTVIGDPTPDFVGSITNRISWKNISLNFALSFSVGQDIYNYQRQQLEAMKNENNQLKSVINRWRYEGQETNVPRAVYDDPMDNARFSDRWIEDGSYMKLKYITISYNIPMQYEMLQGIEFFITGYNLITFTKYKGLDPEFSISNSIFDQGIDVGLTPQPKSLHAGIKFAL